VNLSKTTSCAGHLKKSLPDLHGMAHIFLWLDTNALQRCWLVPYLKHMALNLNSEEVFTLSSLLGNSLFSFQKQSNP
jgi:hypothetical protein